VIWPRVSEVVSEDLSVALERHDPIVALDVVAGGLDGVGRAVLVEAVAPGKARPSAWIACVWGDQEEAGRIDTGWMAEQSDLGCEQEVRRFDLMRVVTARGPGAEEAHDLWG